MTDDPTLTKVERLTLMNQFRILEALYPAEATSYARSREILERGYDSHYGREVFGDVHDNDPMPAGKCGEVCDTLDMFDAIRQSLPEGSPLKDHPHSRFSGYDGNSEPGFMAFAQFTVEGLGRFQDTPRRKADPWNSHCQMREVYGRMLAEWRKVPEADQFGMNEDQLTSVLDAARE